MKRYKAVDHRGDLAAVGKGCTTGHQNRTPPNRKARVLYVMCPRDRMPKLERTGRCHPIRTAVAASQQNQGAGTILAIALPWYEKSL